MKKFAPLPTTEQHQGQKIMPTQTAPPSRKPVNHGDLGPPEKPEIKKPWIPIQLRKARMITHGLPYAQAKEKYGSWNVKILKPIQGPGGIALYEGDSIKLTGDIAFDCVMNERAIFDDPRQAEEEMLLAKAKKLNLPQRIKDIAAFAPQEKKEGWMSKVIQPTPASE